MRIPEKKDWSDYFCFTTMPNWVSILEISIKWIAQSIFYPNIWKITSKNNLIFYFRSLKNYTIYNNSLKQSLFNISLTSPESFSCNTCRQMIYSNKDYSVTLNQDTNLNYWLLERLSMICLTALMYCSQMSKISDKNEHIIGRCQTYHLNAPLNIKYGYFWQNWI